MDPLRRLRLTGRGAALLLTLLLLAGAHPALAAPPLHLPFPSGTGVQIIQGYNGGTHVGVERYSLDLVRADGATSGAAVPAPASGTVAFAQLPGDEHGCIGVAMDGSGDLHYMLCHLILNRAYSYGDRIQVGQLLGTVGAAGLVGNNGTPHVHMQLYTLPGGVRTPVPYAAPDGIPLDGVALPADGTFNQWGCSGAPCRTLVSANASTPGASTAAAPSAAPATPSVVTSAPLGIGQLAMVSGTGDCLRAHTQPSLDAPRTGCAEDGTLVTIANGPVQASGNTWWYLFNLGWAVADYLRATGVASPSATLPSPAAPAVVLSVPLAPTAADNAPQVTTSGIAAGTLVRVTGTGDCLVVHTEPGMNATRAACVPDGVLSVVHDGPRLVDGHTWWRIDGGWAAADYLQPVPFSTPASG